MKKLDLSSTYVVFRSISGYAFEILGKHNSGSFASKKEATRKAIIKANEIYNLKPFGNR